MHRMVTCVDLGQQRIPECISLQPAGAMAEEKTHNWTSEETRALIEWRAANESHFTGRRNSARSGWEDFITTSGLALTSKQAKKKWNNLKDKYKELRDPPTGKGVEAGSVTAATWQWYGAMDAALQGQHSVNPPLVVASNLTATTGGTVSTPASAPSAAEASVSQPPRKRTRDREDLLAFMKEQAERDEQREREALAREEERQRAANEQAERYLALFEKLLNVVQDPCCSKQHLYAAT
ncbi:uncharacterized protein LOC117821960 [Notolabrus celidotus]|uniref:uncharacterized protein LOC117821960 n=1 Tax=Notolabrus celidotus TaxID=1203425 RepID=UPI00148F81AA|nr:uncharacterized protein LOC117821960 [Notolabrus celidotus]